MGTHWNWGFIAAMAFSAAVWAAFFAVGVSLVS